MGTVVIQPQAYVENMFDRADAWSGPFFRDLAFRGRAARATVKIVGA
jgi:hypothetical protein